MARIFISHASSDRVVAEEVSGWLRSAGHQPFLYHDVRDGVSVGEDWKQRLYRELREVDAVIGVVTSSFVASSWCSAELGIADARGCRLMPLRAEAGVVHPLMQELQYVDYHAGPQQARDRVLQAVRLLDDSGGVWREGDNPYPGLEPFTAALSRVFFGRTAEAREVGNRLRTMGSTGGIVAVVGPSGCGKSSLLNAAVVPLVRSDPAWLTVPTLVPGADPLPELARALAATAARLGLRWSASDVRSRLEAGTDGLRRVADDLLSAGTGPQPRRLLITIDQAEELFTRTTPAAVTRFAQLLSDALSGPVHVIAAMRSEFLDDLRTLPELAGTRIEADVLAPLDQEVLRDVIEQPAKVARLSLEGELAAALVADTGGGEALPLLAFTLRQLADGLPAGGTLSLSRYRDLGGVQGALARHADTALAEAVRASGLTDREVLAGLTRLVTVDDTGRRSRRRIRLDGLAEPLRAALQVFIDRRLLVGNTDDGQVWLTVAHEALLTGWRPLDTATADVAIALRTARTVEQAAAEWNSAGRPEHYLWDEKRLTATQSTLGMTGDDSHNPMAPPVIELDEQALVFLDATAQRVQAIKLREQRRRTRTVTTLSILLVLALTGASVAVWQWRSATSAQHLTIARGMLAQADRIRDRDPLGALQLAVAAWQFDSSPQTQAGLHQALAATGHFRTLRGHTGVVSGVAFAPDGHTAATSSADQTTRLWDVSDRNRPRQLGRPLTTGRTSSVTFAPDGRTLATAGADQTVRLWDLTDRTQPHPLGPPLTGHTGAVTRATFTPDGHTLATASADQTVRLWDLTDRTQPHPLGPPLTGHMNTVTGLAFDPDGHTLATASIGSVRLWDLSDRNQPHPLGQPLTDQADALNDVAFAPEGHTLATAGADQTTRLWDVNDRERPYQLTPPLTGHTGAINEVAFAPDGRTLATASTDQTAILWDLADRERPRRLGQPLIGHTGLVNGVMFAPDGRTLATAGADHTARLWDLSDRSQPRPLGQPLTGHVNQVFDLAFAPDGRTLATAAGEVRLWDLSDRDRPRLLAQTLTAHPALRVAFAPDGRTLATAGNDNTILLWDLSDRDRPRQLRQPLTGHTDVVTGVAFTRDGRTLVTTSVDQTIRLWDVSDRNQPRQLGQPLTGHTGLIWRLAIAPDGRTLATASADQTVRLWDLSDRNHPRRLGQPLTGYISPVLAVAFAPDGRTLSTGSTDLRSWDLADPDQPVRLGQPLTVHANGVWAAAFAPDGRTLATGGLDQTVILWNAPRLGTFAGGEVSEACLRAGGSLDTATWEQYAPGTRYQDTCAGR